MQEFPLLTVALCTIFSTQDVSVKDLGRPGLDGRSGGRPRGRLKHAQSFVSLDIPPAPPFNFENFQHSSQVLCADINRATCSSRQSAS